MSLPRRVLVHLGAGIGDIVLATPLLAVLADAGCDVELALQADYAQTAELFTGWAAVSRVRVLRPGEAPYAHDCDAVLPAVPPFYWPMVASRYARVEHAVARPADALFYRDQQGWYLAFAETLGCTVARRPPCMLPVPPRDGGDVGPHTVVLAPGCKTGIMAAKRWPHFATLAEGLTDAVVVGTADDLLDSRGVPLSFPEHVRSFVDRLSLRETAALMAAAGVVVANDSGLAHLAAAIGVPTIMLFGPTSDTVFGGLPANVHVLRAPMPCAPCWHGHRLEACGGAVPCLREIEPRAVRALVQKLVPGEPSQAPRPASRVSVTRDEPLVSCIMPTHDRHAWVPQAVQYFLRQTWTNCELVVVDDGVDGVASMLPRDDRIRHVRVDGRRSIGAMRNLACEHARGEFIAHWDDDDWMSDVRLAVQMRALAEAGGGTVSGLARLPFIDPARRRAWEYRFTGSRPWVAGGTLCYPRDVWQRQPFRDVREGEDTRFVWSLHSRCVVPVEADGLYVATVHAGNTSRKHTSGTQWHVRDYAEVRALLGHDAAFYDALREVPA